MDRKYGGLVKFPKGFFEVSQRFFRVVHFVCQVLEKGVLAPPLDEGSDGFPELSPNPLFQFPCRRLCKSDNQDPTDGEMLFQDQSQKEPCNRVCLASAGACLY